MSQLSVRLGDIQPCPMMVPQPHILATVTVGNPTVLVVGQPAAHLGSALVCTGAPTPNVVVVASATVLVGGMGAARNGDATAHGGALIAGQSTVRFG